MSETTNTTTQASTDDRAASIVEDERAERIEMAACKAYQLFVGYGLKYKEAYRACEKIVGLLGKSQLTQIAEVDERLAACE